MKAFDAGRNGESKTAIRVKTIPSVAGEFAFPEFGITDHAHLHIYESQCPKNHLVQQS